MVGMLLFVGAWSLVNVMWSAWVFKAMQDTYSRQIETERLYVSAQNEWRLLDIERSRGGHRPDPDRAPRAPSPPPTGSKMKSARS